MINDIKSLRATIENDFQQIKNKEDLESFRLKHMVKKGTLQGLINRMKEVPKEEKPLVGKEMNILKTFVNNEFKAIQENLENQADSTPDIDLTLPGRTNFLGTKHPVLQIMDEMIGIFKDMGFSVAEGPEVEDDAHNFDALNFPADHPARDLQDTFFMKHGDRDDILLRTHTSPVQIRLMKEQEPPIRSIMPGRVYRNEAINARSLAEFHQIEGLYIDKGVTFSQLKATMMIFAKKMYGENIKFRFRPHFFPFTEPSAEMDISCFLCGAEGCRVCKYTGWLEIVGCGMVHPNVLKAGGIDPEVYSGFAFGFGIERVAMLRTGVDDIRLFYENDTRVLDQF